MRAPECLEQGTRVAGNEIRKETEAGSHRACGRCQAFGFDSWGSKKSLWSPQKSIRLTVLTGWTPGCRSENRLWDERGGGREARGEAASRKRWEG